MQPMSQGPMPNAAPNMPSWVQPAPQPSNQPIFAPSVPIATPNFTPQSQTAGYMPNPGLGYQPTVQPSQPQSQPIQPITTFQGRYIDDISEVALNEIPMDSRPCFFPTRDAHAIYLKVWNQNGKLLTVRYVMDQDQTMPSLSAEPDPMEQVNERLAKLEEALSVNAKRNQKTKEGA